MTAPHSSTRDASMTGARLPRMQHAGLSPFVICHAARPSAGDIPRRPRLHPNKQAKSEVLASITAGQCKAKARPAGSSPPEIKAKPSPTRDCPECARPRQPRSAVSHSFTDTSTAVPPAPLAPKPAGGNAAYGERKLLRECGRSPEYARASFDAYKSARIPINEKTVSRFHDQTLFEPLRPYQDRPQATLYKATYLIDNKLQACIVKVYKRPNEFSPGEVYGVPIAQAYRNYLTELGIDPDYPQEILRNVMASRLDRHAGWNVVARCEVGTATIDGELRVVLVMEDVGNTRLGHDFPTRSGERGVDVQVEAQVARLGYLSLLIGETDVSGKYDKIFVKANGDNAPSKVTLKAVDFDMSFGALYDRFSRQFGIREIPDAIDARMKDDIEEKLTAKLVADVAHGLLTAAEIEALVKRADVGHLMLWNYYVMAGKVLPNLGVLA